MYCNKSERGSDKTKGKNSNVYTIRNLSTKTWRKNPNYCYAKVYTCRFILDPNGFVEGNPIIGSMRLGVGGGDYLSSTVFTRKLSHAVIICILYILILYTLLHPNGQDHMTVYTYLYQKEKGNVLKGLERFFRNHVRNTQF